MNEPIDQPFLDRLLAELQDGPLQVMEPLEREIFRLRWQQHIRDAIRPLSELYGERRDLRHVVAHMATIAAKAYAQRPADLHLLDLARTSEPDWFQKPEMIGYVCYTDRFAGDLAGLTERIPYLKELGVTYLHLMPLLKPRAGANDGGYAVEDYRAVDPRLGSMADLAGVAQRLRRNGISLCVDLVCNHTAKEHVWARRALAGDPVFLDYYITFPDRTMPDRYEETTPEVFPDFAPGNFTYNEQLGRWVWTTFNDFQWDLNYGNPAVFGAMLENILFLANRGIEVLRLDAVAFMWKRLGTDSQNQPEAHAILQAWRALTRLAAPGLILLAEAIVSPEKVIKYLGRGVATNRECELAYHNVLMVMLWSSLAEREVRLMTKTLTHISAIPTGSAWLTYVRCHDDIGWAVTEEDAAAVGLNGFAHRAFLSDFYSGIFPGTFARGATFQYNPRTGDRRISGAGASLAGLERALELEDPREIDLALRRILLLHGIVLAFGGIPVLYMGDELALLNDYAFIDEPEHADDNRWLHRPVMDWSTAARRHDETAPAGIVFQGLQHLIQRRKALPQFHAQAATQPVWAHNDHVFALIRQSPRGRVLVLGNFTEQPQRVPAYRLQELEFERVLVDCLTDRPVDPRDGILLEPYEQLWLEEQTAP